MSKLMKVVTCEECRHWMQFVKQYKGNDMGICYEVCRTVSEKPVFTRPDNYCCLGEEDKEREK